MTNEQAKLILSLTVQALRQVSVQAFHAHEIVWETYTALMESDSGFQFKFRSASPPTAGELSRLRDDIETTLSQIDEQLQRI